VIPEAMGLSLELVEGRGPVFKKPLASISELVSYETTTAFSWVYEAIEKSVQRLSGIPLIGFAGSPWTLFAYMIEGSGSKNFIKAKTFLWEHPEESLDILEKITDKVIEHLLQQSRAGASALQVFDTWGGLLDAEDFEKFSFYFLQKIAEKMLEENVPLIVFSKGCSGRWSLMKTLKAPCLGVDWTVDLFEVRKIVGEDRVLQGNLDPIVLCAGIEAMKEKLSLLLTKHGFTAPLVINLGHGVTPEARLETVQAFVREAKDLSRYFMARVKT
jgi:uroporphyrinogen decarboxylase